MTPTDQLPPAFAAPGESPAPSSQPLTAAVTPGGTGLATAALIVGIAAFVLGWATILGGLIAIAGIILGILAIRAGRARARSIAGLALSGVAFLFNLFVTAVFIITLATPGAFEELVGIAADNAPDSSETDVAGIELETVTLDTPCYSFASPAGYINNQSAEATAACTTNAELWGEYNADGTVNNTGVGTILGGVTVQAIGTEGTAAMVPDGSLETMMSYLETEYIPLLGTVIGQPEDLTVDGTPAVLTRVTSDVAATKTKALLVLRAPDAYQAAGAEVQFFLIAFVSPEDNGDAIIDAAISSWTWQ